MARHRMWDTGEYANVMEYASWDNAWIEVAAAITKRGDNPNDYDVDAITDATFGSGYAYSGARHKVWWQVVSDTQFWRRVNQHKRANKEG